MLAPSAIPVTSKLVNINEQISVMPSLTNHAKQTEEPVIVNAANVTADKNSTGVTLSYVSEVKYLFTIYYF